MRLATLLTVLVLSRNASGIAETRGGWTVIGAVGKWHVTKTSENKSVDISITVGKPLSAGDLVEIIPVSSRVGSLTLLADDKLVTFACDDPESLPDKSNAGCAHPIPVPVPGAPGAEGSIASIFRKIRQAISVDPQHYYTAASRDSGSLEDSVVAVDNHSTDLRPAFSGLNKGDYHLSLKKLTDSSSSSSTGVSSFQLRWDPDNKQPIAGPDLVPGVYDLSAQTSDGDPAGECWVLVSTTSDFERKSTEFKAVRTQTQSWNQNVPAASVRAVIRATLSQLSQ